MDIPPFFDFIINFVSFYFVTSTQRLYWLYIISALVISSFAYLHLEKEAREEQALENKEDHDIATIQKPTSLLGFLFPKAVFLHPSSLIDYKFFLVNLALIMFVLPPFMLGSTYISDGLFGLFQAAAWFEPSTIAPGVIILSLYTLAMVAAIDLGVYVGHYLQHRIPLLWEFHKVHHSAEVLNPLTVYRMHPIDLIGTAFFVASFMGIVDFLFRCGYKIPLQEYRLYGLNVVTFLFYFVGYNLRHSHIWLAYPQKLMHIFISPAQHQIHHSKDPKHFDKNMGLIFAVWDWMFGTLYVPQEREIIEPGIEEDETAKLNGVWALYSYPFKSAWALVKKDLVSEDLVTDKTKMPTEAPSTKKASL